MRWSFLKAHGLGNDFLLHLRSSGEPLPDPGFVRQVCDRRRGLGGDGVLTLGLLEGSTRASMVLHNADGSVAQISGNGLRCAVAALDRWWSGPSRSEWDVLTGAGWRHGRVLGPSQIRDSHLSVEVTMGTPAFPVIESDPARAFSPGPDGRLVLSVGGCEVVGWPVSIGNPHFVIPGPLPLPGELRRLGPLIEAHPAFPQRTNVIWCDSLPDGALCLRIWERGCGVTAACGSGACAAVAVATLRGHSTRGNSVDVRMEGGNVTVVVGQDSEDELLLRGPVTLVARGEVTR